MTDAAGSASNGRKGWVTPLTILVPVISAIAVATITYQTSLKIAELDRGAKDAAVAVEQGKLREEQDTRYQQFMIQQVPKLLSKDEVERRVAGKLIVLFYAKEAKDSLQDLMPASNTSETSQLIAQAAKAVQQNGAWAISIATDRTIDLPNTWVANAVRLGFTPASIYFHDGWYQTTVGSYSSRQEAEVAAVAVRPKTRPDAYVVSLGHLCPSSTTIQIGDTKVFQCAEK